ncbi:MAG: peptidoglycan DD-metalloendopeptidase family protein [Myxococcales bacterium]
MGSAGPRARNLILAGAAALACACAHKPAARSSPLVQSGVLHHVRAGETLWRIARTYDVPLETLLRENDLRDPSHLSEGSLLFVPGALKELAVPPAGEMPAARVEQRPSRRAGPSSIPGAGQRPLDPAAHGEPLSWPAPGVLISGFGSRERDVHDGIDLACPEGTPVRAAEDGVVLFAGEQRGYGNLILVAHDGDLVTVYAHNSTNLVEKGVRVARGEEIARVGHTGNATGPHLHFEVRLSSHPRDPLGFLR